VSVPPDAPAAADPAPPAEPQLASSEPVAVAPASVSTTPIDTPLLVIVAHDEKPNALVSPRKLAPALVGPALVRLELNPFDTSVVSMRVTDAASVDPMLAVRSDYVTLVQAAGSPSPSSRSADQLPKQPGPPPPGRAPSPDSPAGSGGTAGGIAGTSGGGVVAMFAIAIFALIASGLSSRVATLFATPLSVPRRLSLERPG
jgi:hypothetical protein